MRASTAYFVGAGTIVAAIAIGLGGGIVAGNIMNPIAPKQGPDTGKMAQRAEVAAKPAMTNAPSERVQYIAGSQTFGAVIAAPAQARDDAGPEAKPETQTTQANAQPSAEPPAPQPSQRPQSSRRSRHRQHRRRTQSPPCSRLRRSRPLHLKNAYAKARDSDVKRAASDRRRIDRRERWAERSRYESREQRGMRDRTDWDDVARNVRADSDARDVPAARAALGSCCSVPTTTNA